MNKELYVGIMSGTSLDAVDLVLCEIDETRCILIDSIEHPFYAELKVELLQMINKGETRLEKVGQIDHRLAMLFSEAIFILLAPNGIKASDIRAIGLHGQTLWHSPSGKYPFTMQLGDPNILAAKTGIKVVADFRRKDVALGGQGAPFTPAFHEFIFSNIKKPTAVVNIGGMANITVLDEKLIGYDTGCGNVLMDAWIARHKDVSYDKNGEWARSGEVNYELLSVMMEDKYFSLPYPKSTGREKFNITWLDSVHRSSLSIQNGLRPEDMQRTLLELTALSVSDEVLKFDRDVLLLCGGGAKNFFLVERIKALMPNVEVDIVKNSDYIEAMTFAWLAYKRVYEEKVNLKSVTGARENAVLGGLYV